MRKIVIAGAVLWVAALVATAPLLLHRASTRRVSGWRAQISGGVALVTVVDSQGPAGKLLEAGDRILAVDGESGFTRNYLPRHKIWPYPPGTTYNVSFARRGIAQQITLQIGSVAPHR